MIISPSPSLNRKKVVLGDQLGEFIEKVAIIKPTKAINVAAGFNKRIAPQLDQRGEVCLNIERSITETAMTRGDSETTPHIQIVDEEDCDVVSNSDLHVPQNNPNIAARSAMFEFLSDNMNSLQTEIVQAESTKLRTFERLTSEVIRENKDDKPLMAILKTNGYEFEHLRMISRLSSLQFR